MPLRRRLVATISLVLGLSSAGCRFDACGCVEAEPPEEAAFWGDGGDGDLDVPPGTLVLDFCRPLVLASGLTAEVSAAGDLAAGRRVLLLQNRIDQAYDLGDTTDIGTSTYGDAGSYEVARLATIGVGSPSTLTFEASLTRRFTSQGAARAQLCSIPEYRVVTIDSGGTLSTRAWDGASGGVIAFFVSEKLTLNGAVTASGVGFRGGSPSDMTNPSSSNSLECSACGGKGESLDATGHTRFGRGNLANGGGGGNPNLNAGGGGGAAGKGGRGGINAAELVDRTGIGGARVVAQVGGTQLFFGGGGGSGKRVSLEPEARGGAGGGAIFLHARVLEGSGTFDADGTDGGYGNPSAGAGGGGGGGTVAVWAEESASFSGTYAARGGAGGTAYNDASQRAPGGGGGGGWIIAPSAGDGSVATMRIDGGANGLSSSGAANEAQPGDAGSVVTANLP